MSGVQMGSVCVHVLLLLPPRLGILGQLISGKRRAPLQQEYTALKRCYHVLYIYIYMFWGMRKPPHSTVATTCRAHHHHPSRSRDRIYNTYNVTFEVRSDISTLKLRNGMVMAPLPWGPLYALGSAVRDTPKYS
jgi:hypothetical protein